MKKIISLLSAFAMIATMFTTVAMADDNNYLKWEIKSSSATSLTADLVLKTEHDLTQIQAGFKPTNLKKNGLTSVTLVKAEGGKIGCVANARSVNIAFANTDEPITAGTHVIGTLTLNYTEGSKYKLDAKVDTSYPFLAKYSGAEGTIDYTNKFTNGFFDLEFPAKSETTVTSFTMTPATAAIKGGEKADFTVAIEGTGSFDGFEYKVVNGAGTDVTADVTTLAGKVITFTAPEATDADQTFTITATSTVDTTKTATSTVTVPKKETPVFAPAAGGNMVNPANGKTEKTYLTDIVKFNTDETAPSITIKDEAGETKTFDGNWYPTNLKGQGTINVLVIVRYAGETEKTFSIVNE